MKHDKWLDFYTATPEIPREHHAKARGTPSSAEQLEEIYVDLKSSGNET